MVVESFWTIKEMLNRELLCPPTFRKASSYIYQLKSSRGCWTDVRMNHYKKNTTLRCKFSGNEGKGSVCRRGRESNRMEPLVELFQSEKESKKGGKGRKRERSDARNMMIIQCLKTLN